MKIDNIEISGTVSEVDLVKKAKGGYNVNNDI